MFFEKLTLYTNRVEAQMNHVTHDSLTYKR